jgi:GYF domain 2
MYKVMGADGKGYGPISLEQFSQWAAEGRVSPQTRVQPVGAPDWRSAGRMLAAFATPPTPGGPSVPNRPGRSCPDHAASPQEAATRVSARAGQGP